MEASLPDEADRAVALEDALLSARVAQAQRQVKPVAEPARECCDCGGVIPELRRRANPAARRCVPCQVKMEQGR